MKKILVRALGPFSSSLSFILLLGLLVCGLVIGPGLQAEEILPVDLLLSDRRDTSPSPNGELLNAVIASVDGEPVTWTELQRYLSAQGIKKPGTRNALKKALQEMLISIALVKEAEKTGMSVSDSEIESYLERIQAENGVTSDQFVSLLLERGLSLEVYTTQVRRDILRSRIVRKEVRSKINVVDEDIEKFLAARPELSPESGTVRLHEIRVLRDAANVEEQRNQISALRPSLESLDDWRKFEGKGYRDLGNVDLSELKEELQEKLQDLPVGQVSEVLETDSALQIFFISSRAGADGEPDAVTKEEVRQQIMQSRFKEELDRFISKELPKKYHMEMML